MDNTLDNLIAEFKSKSKDPDSVVPRWDAQRIEEFPQCGGRYSIRVTPIATGKSYWGVLAVEILRNEGTEKIKIGEYLRNYSSMYKTFCPFTKNGKDYAIYSKNYTATRVMSLPDCHDLGGEDPTGFGFCPTEYFVPQPEDGATKDEPGERNELLDGSFGFLCGCVWGDDSSWKIQFLDLSDVENGNIKREARFGYIELPNGDSLRDAITGLDWYEGGLIRIKTELNFNINKSLDVDFSSIPYDEYEKQYRAAHPEQYTACQSCGHAGRWHGTSCPYSNGTARCNCEKFIPTDKTLSDDEI